MIFVDLSPVTNGPRIWFDEKEVTGRCFSLELLPGAQARVHLFAEPMVIDSCSVDTGFGMGRIESEVRKQVYTDFYTIKKCLNCGVKGKK
jgi:hypothetical protein